MKKLFMAAVLATSSVFALAACTSVGATTDTSASKQMQKQYKGGMSKGRVRDGFSQLNLSTKQQSQIQTIRKNNTLDRLQKREAMMNVLSTKQRAQFESLKSERKNEHRRGQHNPWSQLNLSAAQQAQIQAIQQSNKGNRMQKREAVIKVLTPEQRQQLEALKSERQHHGRRGLNE